MGRTALRQCARPRRHGAAEGRRLQEADGGLQRRAARQRGALARARALRLRARARLGARAAAVRAPARRVPGAAVEVRRHEDAARRGAALALSRRGERRPRPAFGAGDRHRQGLLQPRRIRRRQRGAAGDGRHGLQPGGARRVLRAPLPRLDDRRRLDRDPQEPHRRRHLRPDFLATPMIEGLARLVNDNPTIVRWGRRMNETFMVEVGDTQYLIEVQDGLIRAVGKGPFTQRSWRFAIRGKRDAWEKFWQKTPAPGWHDLFGLLRRGEVAFEGDQRVLMAYLMYVKLVLAAPRN